MSPDVKVFAVKLGSDWVEFRAADAPPKPIVTRFKRTATTKEYDPHGPGRSYENPYYDKEHTYTIQVVAHEGGRRLCAMKAGHFRALLGGALATDGEKMKIVWRRGVLEMPEKLTKNFLNSAWRRKNAKP